MKTKLIAASALALALAAPAFAQTALVGLDDLENRIDDIQENVTDDVNTAAAETGFGANPYTQGWAGSVALGFSATYGNTDTADLSLGGRFRYGAGDWNHTVGFAVELAEDNGRRNKEEAFATYDANRFISGDAYVFGLGSVRYDAFGSNQWDVFLGAGPGYRVINQPDMTWRIQAGPGVRYTEDQLGNGSTEVAGLLASRFYRKFNDMVFLTNDTDVLFSQSDTIATNEFGVNVKMSDAMATRVSYRTEYDSDPLPGLEKFDNALGVSLVYGF